MAWHDIGSTWLWQREWQQAWPKLAHVCQQWRAIIFASQRRLDLRLLCTPKTFIKQALDIWPAFYIIVRHTSSHDDWSNTLATLQQRDRVCEINLDFLNSTVFKLLQGPFPLLENLRLAFPTSGKSVPCTCLFWGGPASHRCVLNLGFWLPLIISSATRLVDLRLERIESPSCIPPKLLVTALSTLVQLKTFNLQFIYPASFHSSNLSPPLSGYTHCSTLLRLSFSGPCDYLEDLLSRIRAPSLESMHITLLDPTVLSLHVFEFFRFLCRIESQRLPDVAEVGYYDLGIYLGHIQSKLLPGGQPRRSEWLRLEFPLASDYFFRVFPISWICLQISPILSGVRTLSIPILNDSRDSHWPALLRMFNHVEEVHVTGRYFEFSRVPSTLGLLMARDMLPALRELSLDKTPYLYGFRDRITSLIDWGNRGRCPPITLRWINNYPT